MNVKKNVKKSIKKIIRRIPYNDLLEYYYLEEVRDAKLAKILKRVGNEYCDEVTNYVMQFVPKWKKLSDNEMYIISREKLNEHAGTDILYSEYPRIHLIYSRKDLTEYLVRILTKRKLDIAPNRIELYIESGGVAIDQYEVIRILISNKTNPKFPTEFADWHDFPRASDFKSESECELESGSESESKSD